MITKSKARPTELMSGERSDMRDVLDHDIDGSHRLVEASRVLKEKKSDEQEA